MVKELSKKTEVDLTEDEGGLTVRVQEFYLDPDEKKRFDPVNDKAQPQMECNEVHLPDGSPYQLPEGVDLSGVDQRKAQQVADLLKKYEEAFSKGGLDLGFCDAIQYLTKLMSVVMSPSDNHTGEFLLLR